MVGLLKLKAFARGNVAFLQHQHCTFVLILVRAAMDVNNIKEKQWRSFSHGLLQFLTNNIESYHYLGVNRVDLGVGYFHRYRMLFLNFGRPWMQVIPSFGRFS